MLANLETATRVDEIDANTVKLLFLKEFEKTCSVYLACRNIGISRNTVYLEWLKTDEVFISRFTEIRQGHIDGSEGNIISEAVHNKKNTTAQIFVLKCWRRERYGDQPQELTQNNFILQVSDGLDKTLERLRQPSQSTLTNITPANEIQSESKDLQK